MYFLWVRCRHVALVSIFFVVSVVLAVSLAPSSPEQGPVGSWYSDTATETTATYPLLASLQTYHYTVIAADLSDHGPAPSAPPHLTAQAPTAPQLRVLPDLD